MFNFLDNINKQIKKNTQGKLVIIRSFNFSKKAF